MYREKQYFSALAFSHPCLNTVDAVVDKLLGESFQSIADIYSLENFMVRHMHYLVSQPYHRIIEDLEPNRKVKAPKTKRIGTKRYYLYDCYLMQLCLPSNSLYYFFAAPFRKMLKDSLDANAPTLESERLSFHSIDLLELCDYFSRVDVRRDMKVTRINLQAIVGTSGLKSIALYGDDVLLSEAYALIKVYSSPSSIRISYAGDSSNSISINTDRAGNWSFYLKSQEGLTYLRDMMEYFNRLAIVGTSYNDPRSRISYIDSVIDD